MPVNKKNFYRLSVITLYGFGLAGWAIMEFWLNIPFAEAFYSNIHVFFQIVLGLAYGILAGLIAVVITSQNFMKPALKRFEGLAKNLRLTHQDILFFSACAAIGEEVFFRGALQSLIGIWPAAIIFVALHGYLNPKDWRISIYGIYMVFVSAGFGYLFEYTSLLVPIIAHFIIDVILFKHLQQSLNKQ